MSESKDKYGNSLLCGSVGQMGGKIGTALGELGGNSKRNYRKTNWSVSLRSIRKNNEFFLKE